MCISSGPVPNDEVRAPLVCVLGSPQATVGLEHPWVRKQRVAMYVKVSLLLWAILVCSVDARAFAETDGKGALVINEIMYHPYHPVPGAEEIREEYIELFNRGTEAVNLSGWRLSNGVDFVFPNVTIGAGEYLVVAADPNWLIVNYGGVANVVGGWDGKLSNSGERVELVDSSGGRIDSVRYADQGDWGTRELGPVDHGHRGWIWIAQHDGRGKSLELMNPALPNEYGQNWTASNRDGATPGVINSMAYNDIAPLIVDVTHLPVVPRANDSVVVSARIIDEQAKGLTVTLHYRVDTSTYEDEDIYPEHDPDSCRYVAMLDDGTHGDGQADDGIYGATIPSKRDGTIVEFYIEATDAVTNLRTWPAPSIVDGRWQQVTNALFQVNDSFDGDVQWMPGSQPVYYLIMTEMDKGRLLDIGDREGGEHNSDAQVNATLISVDGVDIKVRHNLGVRNRGHGTRNDPPNNYRLNFPHDRPWKGVTAVNLNTKYTYYQLAGSALFRMSGLPQPEATAVQVRLNGENLAVSGREMYGSYAHIEVVDSDYAGNHFPDGGAGNAYKCMRDLGPADLRYRGTDPDSYRNSYFKRTNTAEDDWSDLIELCYVLSDNTPDDIYVEEVSRVINVDQWLRFIAINALLDNNETSLANGYGDDYYLYRGVEDPRFVLIQHDLDTIFGRNGSVTSGIFRSTALPTIDRFLRHPHFVRRYYFHLRNLIETTFSDEQLRPLLNQFLGDFVPTDVIDDMMDFVAARNQYVLSLIPSELTAESDLPQSDGYYQSSENTFALYGTADPTETRSVLVNGQSAEWSPVDGTWDFGGAGGISEALITRGSVWRYLDDGSNQGMPADGTNWFAHPNYDDSLWLKGPAELGYGDASQGRPEATVINSGPSGDSSITTYFRHTFHVDDASRYSRLHLRLLRDDGAVVYLNGVEVARSNMPAGDIDYLTGAGNGISGADESTFYDVPVGAHLLSDGTNVLAVEIHQVSGTSSDISFDLELEGVMPSEGAGTLRPGINRVIVQTFDGPHGMGNELKREHTDIWYDDGDVLQISSALALDTTLDAGSGPWYVTHDLTVPAGVTLAIERGATVFFDPGVGIVVESGGRLVAEGTEYERIRLTSVLGSGSRWDGIQFNQTAEDNYLSHVDMEYGDGLAQAIKIDHARLAIDSATWTRTDKNILDVSHPRLVVRNSVFPDQDNEEAIYGDGLSGDEYLIIEGNRFGRPSGYQDVIDFADCHRPGPIIEIYNNVFLGGEDDGVDLDNADACIEGNVFKDFLGGSGTGTPNAIAADQGSRITVARNIFYDNTNAVLLKGSADMRAENNTFAGHAGSAIHFFESGSVSGKGASMDGNVFWDNANVFQSIDDQVELAVRRSILPAEWHHLGEDNIDGDPLFVDPNTDFRLKPSSPAISAGPCGLDMGAYVPSGAAICGEPDERTYRRGATLIVDGPGITHYRYRLNDEPWSDEYPVHIPIQLTNLRNGQSYTVYVIGKNSAGVWQSENDPTASRTWTVDTSYSKLLINEVLAINISSVEHEGTYPDLIELYYDGPAALNLSGMSISDNPEDPARFVFPAGATLQPGAYLVLYADSGTTTSGIHLAFALNGNGEGIYLYDRSGTLLDSVEFGLQLPDLSIGRAGHDGQWRLTVPTFGGANVAQPLGDPQTLKINEFLADGLVLFEDDFIELFNPHPAPVDLSSLYLTDNPITQPQKSPLGPLGFIAGEGFCVFIADESSQPGHVDFRLSPDGEMIALLDAGLNEIDKVLYQPQTTDVSYGRVPDGMGNLTFFGLPTPGIANPSSGPPTVTIVSLVPESADKRVLVPTDDIGQAWIEPDFDDSAWNLCTGGPGGVGYERTQGYEDLIRLDLEQQMYAENTTCYIRIPFRVEADALAGLSELTLKIRYDDGFVAYLNGVEVASRNFLGAPAWDSRAGASHSDSAAREFEPIDISGFIGDLKLDNNILAIHGLNSSRTSSDALISAELEAGVVVPANEFPFFGALELLAGLRVTELMYHAAGGSEFDYIELQNISETTLDLTGARLDGGITFTFPEIVLEAGRHVMVVSDWAAFQSAHGTNIPVAGEYSGNLSNSGERIVLQLPWPLEAAILRFEYSDTWFPTTDGGGNSLAIADPSAHPATWDWPESWHPASPSPGR